LYDIIYYIILNSYTHLAITKCTINTATTSTPSLYNTYIRKPSSSPSSSSSSSSKIIILYPNKKIGFTCIVRCTFDKASNHAFTNIFFGTPCVLLFEIHIIMHYNIIIIMGPISEVMIKYFWLE